MQEWGRVWAQFCPSAQHPSHPPSWVFTLKKDVQPQDTTQGCPKLRPCPRMSFPTFSHRWAATVNHSSICIRFLVNQLACPVGLDMKGSHRCSVFTIFQRPPWLRPLSLSPIFFLPMNEVGSGPGATRSWCFDLAAQTLFFGFIQGWAKVGLQWRVCKNRIYSCILIY